ncbi:MAG: FtsX-like permease family protein, partial [Bacteroidales bacterium]|nr:FtsX-like permease family protein [Bacteroidales bacterium]
MASIIAVAVIIGSLLVGHSVRTTLVNRVSERLGDIETVISSGESYLSDDILENSLLNSASGMIIMNGFVPDAGRLIPVTVYGTNDMSLDRGKSLINKALYDELTNTSVVVLRLPAKGMVPSGSLFVTDNYTTSLRLSVDRVLDVDDGGNLNLNNDQTIPHNVFINRDELAELLDIQGKINLILSNESFNYDDFSKVWKYENSGIKVKKEMDYYEVTSDRVFIQPDVVSSLYAGDNVVDRRFVYFANSLQGKRNAIPYSFVTAVDMYCGEMLNSDDIILTDYSAKRLGVSVGDEVTVSYFVSGDFKTLSSDSITFKVRKIVPITDFVSEEGLKANFPGLSNVERCTDWDSDLPIDMSLISDEDEKYWDVYKNTPKAIIPYSAVVDDWSNVYGSATSLKLSSDRNLSELTLGMFGIVVSNPRESGLYAANNGVDFSGLFMALSFFIIIAAYLLIVTPIEEMVTRRKSEWITLESLGYSKDRIFHLLWMESWPIVSLSSVVGVLFGIIYTGVVMWLLGNVWKGATNTENFSLYISAPMLLYGLVAGIVVSLLVLRYTIKGAIKGEKHKKTKVGFGKGRLMFILSLLGITIILSIVNLLIYHSIALFVVIGLLFITAAAMIGDYYIINRKQKMGLFDDNKLIIQTLYSSRRQNIISFIVLSLGVFIVFAVGLNRRSFTDRDKLKRGTGGYSLWCHSVVPIYHNMSSDEGRLKLALSDLPYNTSILQCLRHGADEASCLNLNKVSVPTVIGIDMNSLKKSDFIVTNSIFEDTRPNSFDMFDKRIGDAYPALVDETVLAWSLVKKLGDTIRYDIGEGHYVDVIIAGTIANSVFQGNILVDKKLFSELWPNVTGSEIFLVKCDDSDVDNVKMLLGHALSQYGVDLVTTNDRLKQF